MLGVICVLELEQTRSFLTELEGQIQESMVAGLSCCVGFTHRYTLGLTQRYTLGFTNRYTYKRLVTAVLGLHVYILT